MRPERALKRRNRPVTRRLAAMNDECECQSSLFAQGSGPSLCLGESPVLVKPAHGFADRDTQEKCIRRRDPNIMADTVVPGLERRLKAEVSGDIGFDRFTRGRYATDASHYRIMP